MSTAAETIGKRISEYQDARIETARRLEGLIGKDEMRIVERLMTLSREMGELHAQLYALQRWGI